MVERPVSSIREHPENYIGVSGFPLSLQSTMQMAQRNDIHLWSFWMVADPQNEAPPAKWSRVDYEMVRELGFFLAAISTPSATYFSFGARMAWQTFYGQVRFEHENYR